MRTHRVALSDSQQALSRREGRRRALKPDVVYRLSGLLPKIERKDLFKADAFCFLVEIKHGDSHTHKSSLLGPRELALGLSWGIVEGSKGSVSSKIWPSKLLGVGRHI